MQQKYGIFWTQDSSSRKVTHGCVVYAPKDSGLNKMRNLTPNFCFRLDDLKRRIVALRNDLRSFKLEQKGKLSFVSYLILSPKDGINRGAHKHDVMQAF